MLYIFYYNEIKSNRSLKNITAPTIGKRVTPQGCPKGGTLRLERKPYSWCVLLNSNMVMSETHD
jgi:hypothetical protein